MTKLRACLFLCSHFPCVFLYCACYRLSWIPQNSFVEILSPSTVTGTVSEDDRVFKETGKVEGVTWVSPNPFARCAYHEVVLWTHIGEIPMRKLKDGTLISGL